MLPEWLSPAAAWFILGVILLVFELAIGGFLAIFFAAGAWLTGLLLWIGLFDGVWPSLAVFLIGSVVALLLLRRRMKPVAGVPVDPALDTDRKLDDFAGRRATVVETIDVAGNTGKVEFRGSHWNAVAKERIEVGSVVEIISRDNITLKVKPLSE